jgi:hypothetical protein
MIERGVKRAMNDRFKCTFNPPPVHYETLKGQPMKTPSQRQNLEQMVAQIAAQYLLIETLETRNHDRLDFHEVPVWGIHAALMAAYAAGRASAGK